MSNDNIAQLLQDVQASRLSIADALEQLRWQPVQAVDEFAQVDSHRAMRQGMPEFVYAEGKTPTQTAAIVKALVEQNGAALASRANPDHFAAVQVEFPQAIYNEAARLITVGESPTNPVGQALVVAAGTSDLPVAEEAAGVLRFLGDQTQTLFDVGVAGIHRLFQHHDTLTQADVLIVVAGLEGALPTVVGGLVDAPLIAVPTSVGYGASFGGVAALLGMLNSCVPGVTVVNIDNGLGAAASAHRVLHRLRAHNKD
jgi:pyridinium-3,5-biscarboxylic acid mononucleotide synthase